MLYKPKPTFLLTSERASFKKNRLRAVLACAESNFLKFKFEYLRKNEFLRKTILACLSGDQMGLINEKNRGQKSRDTAPLRRMNPEVYVTTNNTVQLKRG